MPPIMLSFDFLFSPTAILKIWIVPLSEAQETYSLLGSIQISVMTAWSAPLLTSWSWLPSLVLKILISVPLLLAVHTIDPSWLNLRAAIAALWALNCIISFWFDAFWDALLKWTTLTYPNYSSGHASTQLSS